jgi:hypothetical protein
MQLTVGRLVIWSVDACCWVLLYHVRDDAVQAELWFMMQDASVNAAALQ